MHEVLVNCLLKLAQEIMWLGELTIAVDLGRKATTNKQKKKIFITPIYAYRAQPGYIQIKNNVDPDKLV